MHTSYRHPIRTLYTPPSSATRSGTPTSYMATIAGRAHSQDHSPPRSATGSDYVNIQLEEVDLFKGIADTARQNGDFEKVYRYYLKAANTIRPLLKPEYEQMMTGRMRTSLIRTINGLEKWMKDYDESPQHRHALVHDWVATDKMDGSPAFETRLRREEVVQNARIRSDNNKGRIREPDLLDRNDHNAERIYVKEAIKERKESEANERADARKKRDKERGRERRSKLEGRRDYMPGGDDSYAEFAPPPPPTSIASGSSDVTVTVERVNTRKGVGRAGKENVDYGTSYSLHTAGPSVQPIPPLTPDKTPEQATDGSADSTPHLPPHISQEPYMRRESLDYNPPSRHAVQRGAGSMPSPPEEGTVRDVKPVRSNSNAEDQQWRQNAIHDPAPPLNAPQWEHEAWIKRNGRKLPPRVIAIHDEYGRRTSQDDTTYVSRGASQPPSSTPKDKYTESPKASDPMLDPGPSLSRRPSGDTRASTMPAELPSSERTSARSSPAVQTPVRGATVPTTLPSMVPQKLSPVGKAWDAVPALKSPPPVSSGQRTLGPHRQDSIRTSNPTTPTNPSRRGSIDALPAMPVTMRGSGDNYSASKYSFPHQQSPYGKGNGAGDSPAPLLSNSTNRTVIKPPEESALFNTTPGDLVKIPQVPQGMAAPDDPKWWLMPTYERPIQIQVPPRSTFPPGLFRSRAVYLPPNYMTCFLDGIASNRRAGLETVALLLGVLDEKNKTSFQVTTLLFPPQQSHHQFSQITDDAMVADYCERLGAQVVGVMHWSFAGINNSVNSFTGWDLHTLYKYQSIIPETVGIAVTTRPEDAGKAVHLMRSLSQNAMREIAQCYEDIPYHFHGGVDEVFDSRPRGNLPHVVVDDKLLLHVEDLRQ